MTPEQGALVDRLRALLADEPAVREVAMFGGRSFMVSEKIAVSGLKSGACSCASTPTVTTSSSAGRVLGRPRWVPDGRWVRGGSTSPPRRSATTPG